MRKIICMMSAIMLLSVSLQAQENRKKEGTPRQERRMAQAGKVRAGARAERINAIKVGYITDKLKLNSSQATAFWPVYNEYERELREARRSFRQKYRSGAADENNARARSYIEDNLDLQEATVGIKRKYKDRFLKVISAQQLAALYEAERDFKKQLIRQLRQGRGNK